MQVIVNTQERDYNLLILRGDFIVSSDDSSIEIFREKIHLLSHENKHLIIDLSDVAVFASLAIGVLLSAYRNINESNKVIVFGAKGWVANSLKLARIDNFISMTDTLKSALKILSD